MSTQRQAATPVRQPDVEPPESATAESASWPLAVSLVLFFGSGFSALVYELVWFQLLEQVVGSSALSLGILLGIFMGGLGLGSLLLPRLVSHRAHPFRIYAWLELGLAVAGVLVLFEVPLMGRIYMGTGSHGARELVLRGAIAGLSLLPPTILMGATLPAIARWVKVTPGGVGWLGRLYASNIVGGICGCLVAGFYLLRRFDVATASAAAIVTNLAVAAIALLLAARTRHAGSSTRPPRLAPLGRRATAIDVTIAVSGLCALAGEVVWTRLLSLLLGPTVYTFSIILAVFLFGLGVGSGLGSMVARDTRHPGRALGICQLLLCGAIAWAAAAVNQSLPYWPPPLAHSAWITFQLDITRCLWALLPATLLWGASFPLALAAGAGKEVADPGRLVAGIYASNTLGAILGALLFTLWVVPSVGTRTAQQAMIVLSAAGGMGLLGLYAWRRRKSPGTGLALGAIAGVAALALAMVLLVPPLPGAVVALGRYVSLGLVPGSAAAAGADGRLLYVGEGLTSSVAVSQNGPIRLFHVAGKVEASTHVDDMRLQRMLGHLPALIQGAPRSVLVVGCGAGVTAGTFTRYPSVERIMICEIEPLVPTRIAPFFQDENYGVVSDPRTQIVYDDARHYVLTTRKKFDVITSDPIHPWVRGSAALYSSDYFRLVRSHLNPGGVVSQWVPIYEASEKSVRGEIATFLSVFPNATLWANRNSAGGYDLVMVGTVDPPTIALDRLAQDLARPEMQPVAASLQSVGFHGPLELLSTYVGRGPDLAPWLAGAEVNRDPKPWLQYQAGLDSYTEQRADVFGEILRYRRFPEDLFAGPVELQQALQRAGRSDSRSAP